MGVVYKLTPEIVDFILRQKKAMPELSCRNLVDIVKSSYAVVLSKSSINKVLKNYRLSSPVGRRPDGEMASKKKFKIPEDKKMQIFPGLEPERSLPSKKEPKASKGPARAPKSVSPKPPSEPRVKEPAMDVGGIGAIFLKAAEWSMSEGPLLATFIKAQLKGDSMADIDTIADILLYSRIYGIKQVDDFTQYKSKGLWLLHGLQESINKQTLYDTINNISDSRRLAMDLSLEIPSLFTKVFYIKVVLEDGEEIFIDPLLVSVHQKNVQTGHFSSLNQTIQTVVEQIIDNVHSAIFCSAGSQNGEHNFDLIPGEKNSIGLSRYFMPLIWSFNKKSGKKIHNIGIYDQNDQEIINFDDIPDIQRSWIAGIWPWQSGFEKLTWEGKVHRFSHDYASAELFYRKIKTNHLDASFPITGYVLSEAKDSPPILAIFNNQTDLKADETLAQYLNNWPNLEKGYFIHLLKTYSFFIDEERNMDKNIHENQDFMIDFTESANSAIFQLAENLLELLSGYCLERFFWPAFMDYNLNDAITDIYSLSGNIEKKEKNLCVTLNLADSAFRQDIEKAVKILNENRICDFQGRQLFVKCRN